MRIDVTYAGEASRIIETSGESMLSSSTMANAPEWKAKGLPVTAMMLRPRTDLIGMGGHGLVIELCGWSSDVAGRNRTTIDDLGGRHEVSRLLFHVFRTWEVLPASELERAIAVDIDGRIHLLRIGGRLLDLTAYERVESTLLSATEASEMPLDQRVLLVHDRLRWTHPGLEDDAIGDLYGLGSALFDYATSMAGSDESSSDNQKDDNERAPEPEDGFGELVAALAGAQDRDQQVDVLAEAMFDDPSLKYEDLERALEARDVRLDDLDGIWNDAEGEVDDFTGL